MDPYKQHMEARKQYAKDNKPLIKQIRSSNWASDNQHILWMKTVVAELEDDKGCRTFEAEDGTFGFTEMLVNRLMHFAYLKANRNFEEESYRKGWEDATKSAIEKLGGRYGEDE